MKNWQGHAGSMSPKLVQIVTPAVVMRAVVAFHAAIEVQMRLHRHDVDQSIELRTIALEEMPAGDPDPDLAMD